jgi:hypothetical protein
MICADTYNLIDLYWISVIKEGIVVCIKWPYTGLKKTEPITFQCHSSVRIILFFSSNK